MQAKVPGSGDLRHHLRGEELVRERRGIRLTGRASRRPRCDRGELSRRRPPAEDPHTPAAGFTGMRWPPLLAKVGKRRCGTSPPGVVAGLKSLTERGSLSVGAALVTA